LSTRSRHLLDPSPKVSAGLWKAIPEFQAIVLIGSPVTRANCSVWIRTYAVAVAGRWVFRFSCGKPPGPRASPVAPRLSEAGRSLLR
ncbi:hypothetical protein GT037_004083, partial [Alternaria burnsii]